MLSFSRFASRVAQNAVNFALVLLIVGETGKAFYSSLLVVVLVIPATLAGLMAGAVADAFPRRVVMVLGNVLRAGICAWFAFNGGEVSSYFIVAAMLSIATQFAVAPESGLVAAMVAREDLARANAISQAITGVAQLTGFVILTPLLLRVFRSPEALFLTCGGLYLVAAFYAMVIGGRFHAARTDVGGAPPPRDPWWKSGWLQMRRDPLVLQAAIELTLISTALIILGGLVPTFIRETLGLPVDIGAVVLVPAALGIALGLRIAGFLARHVPHAVMSTAGIIAFGGFLAVLAFTNEAATFLTGYSAFGWLDTLSIGSLRRGGILAAIIVMPLGFAYATVMVAGQTVITDRVPLGLQGRVNSTQNALAAVASSLPVLAAGLLADRFGVTLVMALVSGAIGAFAVFNLRTRRRAALAAGPGPREVNRDSGFGPRPRH